MKFISFEIVVVEKFLIKNFRDTKSLFARNAVLHDPVCFGRITVASRTYMYDDVSG